MAGKRIDDKKKLRNIIKTRVNDDKYKELCLLLEGNAQNDMSRLIRDILYNRPIKVFTKDKNLDGVMEELAQLRSEVRAVGVNINQITRLFNTYPDPARKFAQAKIAFDQYLQLKDTIDRLLVIVSNLSKKWLQG